VEPNVKVKLNTAAFYVGGFGFYWRFRNRYPETAFYNFPRYIE